MASDPAEVVRAFCAAWARLDLDELMEYFAEDSVYHNMPGPPVVGKEAIRRAVAGFLSGWTATDWEIINLAATGSTVFAERIDRTSAGDKQVDLPVVGVFEIAEGRIQAWRDYFDLATYTRAMSAE